MLMTDNDGRRFLPASFIISTAAAALIATPLATASAETKVARCLVISNNQVDYRGRCRFGTDGPDGSFYIERLNRNRALTGSVMSISVTMTGRGTAEVRGLTRQGINSRWGSARRSARRPACWVGTGFSICAWGCKTRNCR